MKTLEQLDYENKRKKQSMKNKIAWYSMFLIPLSIVAQIIITALGSTLTLPLELIIGGGYGLIGLYFGANFAQKKFIFKEEEGE